MLARNLYVEIVNRLYKLEGEKKLPSLQPVDAPARILEEVKQHFRTVATEGAEFDHLSPAVYLMEHDSDFSDAESVDTALSRFKKLFKDVNRLLPPV